MGMNKDQLRSLIERVLKEADLYSEDATELLLLTAATESNLGEYIRQVGGGPARGIFQIEKYTEEDIELNYLRYRAVLDCKIEAICPPSVLDDEMEWNLAYQILMARIHYLRVPHPLPNTVEGMAKYWKQWYNTPLGKGTVEKAIERYTTLCL